MPRNGWGQLHPFDNENGSGDLEMLLGGFVLKMVQTSEFAHIDSLSVQKWMFAARSSGPRLRFRTRKRWLCAKADVCPPFSATKPPDMHMLVG